MSTETTYDNLIARGASVRVMSSLPATADAYYGENVGQAAEPRDWIGGELVYLTTHNKLYMNSATSGRTATWRRLADAFATSTTSTTTSTSTSTSSTTTTSTTTTSSSSTTSTSTSTTSTTSTSTSTTSSTSSTTTSTSTSTSSSTTSSSTSSSTTTTA